MPRSLHVSDADLVLALDGELDAPRLRYVDEHLLSCWRCRARRTAIARAMEGFVDWQDGLKVPPPEGPRALLNARMAHAITEQPHRGLLSQSWGRVASAALVCAATFAVGILIWTNAASNLAAATPDPEHTPGITVPMSADEVCRQTNASEHPEIPPSLARQVFDRYGIQDPRPRSYEIDYLITPALGGAADLRNLWPQPYASGVWNSHIKDALEEHLRGEVCAGRLPLAQAQAELARNWVSAYRKYFHSATPLAAHTAFIKDRPWE